MNDVTLDNDDVDDVPFYNDNVTCKLRTERDVTFESQSLHFHIFFEIVQLGIVERQTPIKHGKQDDAPVTKHTYIFYLVNSLPRSNANSLKTKQPA